MDKAETAGRRKGGKREREGKKEIPLNLPSSRVSIQAERPNRNQCRETNLFTSSRVIRPQGVNHFYPKRRRKEKKRMFPGTHRLTAITGSGQALPSLLASYWSERADGEHIGSTREHVGTG